MSDLNDFKNKDLKNGLGPGDQNQDVSRKIDPAMREALASAMETFRKIRQGAQDGDPESQYLLGQHYEHGLFVPKDPREAAVWYRTAAEQGYLQGQKSLAML